MTVYRLHNINQRFFKDTLKGCNNLNVKLRASLLRHLQCFHTLRNPLLHFILHVLCIVMIFAQVITLKNKFIITLENIYSDLMFWTNRYQVFAKRDSFIVVKNRQNQAFNS